MIRQFQSEDASSCCALIRGCVESDPSYSPALLRKMRVSETPEAMAERAKLFYLAVYEEDGQVLGVAGLDMNEIRLLYVSTMHQGRGIGRSLVEHLKSMVPHMLFTDIFVYSTKRAVPFYRACGFIDKGPFTLDWEGEPLETVFMAFPLP